MPLDKTTLIAGAQGRIADLHRMQEAGLVCLTGDFFPSVHYPPITMYPPITEEHLFEGYTSPSDGLFDLYAHIPFCIQACAFCHYPVKVGDQAAEKDHYLRVLDREMAIYLERLGLEVVKARSILVGGGTPTYLTPAQLKRFLESFSSKVDTSSCTQFNYDVDPSSLLGPDGKERLRIMRDHGVDRLTIGVQSLNDGILKLMNSAHDSTKARAAVERSLDAGFKTNIEFIFGYLGQDVDNWIEVMEEAVTLGTEEIQLYRLKFYPYGDRTGPILKKLHTSDAPSVEEVVVMKHAAITILAENGYHENLGRVYTRTREDYSHYADNQCCRLRDQLGFGLTAFSSLRDRFALNTQVFKDYYDAIEHGRLPVNRGLVRTKEDQLRWSVVLPLKNRDVRKDFFERENGVAVGRAFPKKIEKLKRWGLLSEDEKRLILTPLGRFFADDVCIQFHHPDAMPFPESAYAAAELNPYRDVESPLCPEPSNAS